MSAKILIVEDSNDDAFFLRECIDEAYAIIGDYVCPSADGTKCSMCVRVYGKEPNEKDCFRYESKIVATMKEAIECSKDHDIAFVDTSLLDSSVNETLVSISKLACTAVAVTSGQMKPEIAYYFATSKSISYMPKSVNKSETIAMILFTIGKHDILRRRRALEERADRKLLESLKAL